MKLPAISQEQEPNGKRWYRWNVYGNYVGYIGNRRWMTFANEFDAIEWVNAKEQSNENRINGN